MFGYILVPFPVVQPPSRAKPRLIIVKRQLQDLQKLYDKQYFAANQANAAVYFAHRLNALYVANITHQLPALKAPLLLRMIAAIVVARTFACDQNGFYLDDKPFTFHAGEIHPFRIEYHEWEKHLKQIKAQNYNAVSVSLPWNQYLDEAGQIDFTSPQNNIDDFFKLCILEELFVLVKVGPFLNIEVDFGGIPARFATDKLENLRSSANPEFMKAASGYLAALAGVLAPNMISKDGPILMIAIEDSYSTNTVQDKDYLSFLRSVLVENGFDGMFYTIDAAQHLAAGIHFQGEPIGLSGYPSENDYKIARQIDDTVPVFPAKVYSGVPDVWGQHYNSSAIFIGEFMQQCIDNFQSFVVYLASGGSNYGLSAGSEMVNYRPTSFVTSHEYHAPITESGAPGEYYTEYQKIMAGGKQSPGGQLAGVPTMQTFPIKLLRVAGLFDQPFIREDSSPDPQAFEFYGQNQGLAIYTVEVRDMLLRIRFQYGDAHCYFYLNDQFLKEQDIWQTTFVSFNEQKIEYPSKLEILCDTTGHLKPERQPERPIIDTRKGLAGPVSIDSTTPKEWEFRRLPLQNFPSILVENDKYPQKMGGIFKQSFELKAPASTFFDFSHFSKGYAYINGHLLGRYWNIGPQRRLYCPKAWLQEGNNTIVVLDLEQQNPGPVSGFELPTGCPEGKKLVDDMCQ